MSQTAEPPEEMSEEEFSRPFMASGIVDIAFAQSDSSGEQPQDEESEAIRPYFVTGGRVHEDLSGFETTYCLTDKGEAALAGLTYEHRRVAQLCEEPQSVAELSAHLGLPLGVAMVLAKDLAAKDYLDSTTTIPDISSDPALIMRLIDAIHKL
jgi:hypothetical protein